MPFAARANHLATRGEGHVEYRPQVRVQAIEHHGPDRGFRLVATAGRDELVWEVERIIANVGCRPSLRFCEELHVGEPSAIRQPEPSWFTLGAKSRGRDSSFLMRDARDAIRDLFAALTGKPRLDLYQRPALGLAG
jgi:hypothetical protein